MKMATHVYNTQTGDLEDVRCDPHKFIKWEDTLQEMKRSGQYCGQCKCMPCQCSRATYCTAAYNGFDCNCQ